MKSKIFLIAVFLCAVGLNGCGFLSKKYTKSETSTHSIYAGNKTKITLENINGNIMISQISDSNSMIIKAYKEVKVKKKYLNTPFDEIEVQLDTNSEIVIVYTDINKNGSDDIFNLSRKQRVDYEIYLPSNIEININNVNGLVTTDGIANNLTVSQINGDVDISNFTGKLDCEITNGSFSGKIDSTSGININTINGNVTLFLNNYMNANVRAESMNSRIIDENLMFRDVTKEKKFFRGKLGNVNTGVEIDVETVNGRIKLYGKNEI